MWVFVTIYYILMFVVVRYIFDCFICVKYGRICPISKSELILKDYCNVDNITISETDQVMNEVPLSRSLGFPTRKSIGKTLEDTRIGKEDIVLYNEMLKASQESGGKFGGGDDFDLGTDLTRLKGIIDRRRSNRMGSPIRQRRARTQALRREKLNSQSLRSHMEHSRHSSLERRASMT